MGKRSSSHEAPASVALCMSGVKVRGPVNISQFEWKRLIDKYLLGPQSWSIFSHIAQHSGPALCVEPRCCKWVFSRVKCSYRPDPSASHAADGETARFQTLAERRAFTVRPVTCLQQEAPRTFVSFAVGTRRRGTASPGIQECGSVCADARCSRGGDAQRLRGRIWTKQELQCVGVLQRRPNTTAEVLSGGFRSGKAS